MPRMVAVDWGRHEARFVLASTAGGKVRIRAAASAPLIDVIEGGSEPQPDLGHSLRAALAEEKLGRVIGLVAVNRSSIELWHFTLPPAQDGELPELVLNQAMRESPNINEETALDFFPLDEDPTKPRQVTAAALSPEAIERVKAACAVAGVKARRLLLRPYASASLFSRAAPALISPPQSASAAGAKPLPPSHSGQATVQICLLVNLLGDEVDLTVLVEGKARFSRTVRLPRFADPQQADERVVAEVKRTMAVAVHEQTGGNPVESVFIFGAEGEHQGLLERIRVELSLPVAVFNPFAAVDASAVEIPEDPGRFAALLGMLLDEAACPSVAWPQWLRRSGFAPVAWPSRPRGAERGREGPRRARRPDHGGHAIDFLHPRRQPKRISRGQIIAVASGLVAAVLLAAGYFAWSEFAEVDRTNRQLSQQYKKLNDLLIATAQERKIVEAVRRWQAGDVLWLEELRELSLQFPPSQDAVVARMSMTSGQSGGGVIDIRGLVSDDSILFPMDVRLRHKYHSVDRGPVQRTGQEGDYTWHFNTSVRVARRHKSQYVYHLADRLPSNPDAVATIEGNPKALREAPPGKGSQAGDKPR